MHIKESEYNRENKHINTKILELDSSGKIIQEHLIFEYDEFADFPFSDDEESGNGFDEISGPEHFKKAEKINDEFVVIRKNYAYDHYLRTQFEIENRTFFNEKGQVIRIEEDGRHFGYEIRFEYDENENLILEKITKGTPPFGFKELRKKYITKFNFRTKRKQDFLIRSIFDDTDEKIYSYNQFGDKISEIHINKKWDRINEEQYYYEYDHNNNWILKKYFSDGDLQSLTKREYGYFSELIPKEEESDNFDGNSLPF